MEFWDAGIIHRICSRCTEHGIEAFDLVVVNLYPFEATVAKPGVTPAKRSSKSIIGGPSLIRAAAKNHAFVAVATSTEQYARIINEVETHGGTSLELRRELALQCFLATTAYDAAIASYFQSQLNPQMFPAEMNLHITHKAALRLWRESPQQAALYKLPAIATASLVTARQINGKELSYNNLLDLD